MIYTIMIEETGRRLNWSDDGHEMFDDCKLLFLPLPPFFSTDLSRESKIDEIELDFSDSIYLLTR